MPTISSNDTIIFKMKITTCRLSLACHRTFGLGLCSSTRAQQQKQIDHKRTGGKFRWLVGTHFSASCLGSTTKYLQLKWENPTWRMTRKVLINISGVLLGCLSLVVVSEGAISFRSSKVFSIEIPSLEMNWCARNAEDVIPIEIRLKRIPSTAWNRLAITSPHLISHVGSTGVHTHTNTLPDLLA